MGTKTIQCPFVRARKSINQGQEQNGTFSGLSFGFRGDVGTTALAAVEPRIGRMELYVRGTVGWNNGTKVGGFHPTIARLAEVPTFRWDPVSILSVLTSSH